MFKYLNIALLILVGITASAGTARAATEFLVSWRANTFVDAGYAGKILPTHGSRVSLAFELLENGKPADISKNEVKWFIDGNKFDSGIGKRMSVLNLPTLSSNESANIKILVRQYRGADIEKFFTVPVASPEAVIDSRYPQNIITSGLNNFTPLFYFWNTNKASNLLVSWTSGDADSQQLNGDNILQLSIPDGAKNTQLRLAMTAKNPEREFETAVSSLTLKL